MVALPMPRLGPDGSAPVAARPARIELTWASRADGSGVDAESLDQVPNGVAPLRSMTASIAAEGLASPFGRQTLPPAQT